MKRTTITIDEELLREARELTGINRVSDLLNESLAEVIRVNSARRLAALCGSDPDAYAAPRSR